MPTTETGRSPQVTVHVTEQGAGLPPPTNNELDLALDQLLDTLMEHRNQRAPSGRLEAYFAGDLMATPEDVVVERDWAAAPVDIALKRGMHEVAALLAARLTLDQLEDAATRVAASCSDATGLGGRRYTILSSAFNGLVARDGGVWIS